MLITIRDGKPSFIFDQLMLVKEIRELFNYYQTGSIEYAILFGWAGSPFVNIEDLRLRNETVLLELKSGEWSLNVEKLEAAKMLWDRPLVKNAIEKINVIFKLKYLTNAQFYKNEIEKLKVMLEQATKTFTDAQKGTRTKDKDGEQITINGGMDPGDLKKVVEAKATIMKEIKAMEKDYEEEVNKARTFMESKTERSINHFIEL